MNALTTDPRNQPCSRTFDDLVLESIDQTLTDLVGERTKPIILNYLEKNCSMPHDDIPKKPAMFFTLLEELSGRAGVVIGRAALRKLYLKLGWEFIELPGFKTIDYLEAAKARFSRESRGLSSELLE